MVVCNLALKYWTWIVMYWPRVQVGQIFEFVEIILFLETNLGGGLAPSGQTVGSLLIPPEKQSRLEK